MPDKNPFMATEVVAQAARPGGWLVLSLVGDHLIASQSCHWSNWMNDKPASEVAISALPLLRMGIRCPLGFAF
jgi:hypothetical protein